MAQGRFLAKVEKTETCWLWRGALSPYGYGKFRLNGKTEQAHRASYRLFTGVIPHGLTIDHKCGVKACVNPEHLEPVSLRENNLRSPRTIIGRNIRATHCPRGHEYSVENTSIRKNGSRRCKKCHVIEELARRKRKDKSNG